MSYLDQLQRQRVLNAPMCGISDFPFRALCRAMGAALTFAEMVSAEGVVRGDRGRLARLDLEPGEPRVAMQLFGREPKALAEAARRLQDRAVAVIDFNMGCPVRKVVASRAGSALLCDLPRVARIFKAMRAAITIPFTVKMRWDGEDGEGRPGWQRGGALEAARIAQDEGLDAICLHPRTRAQGYSGQACWEQIARLKASVSIPVIGNGDIREPADALAMTARTGCDAVMIGRALIGDPWLMRATIEAFERGSAVPGRLTPGWEERSRMILRHGAMMFERRGLKAFAMFRKHAAAYLRGLSGVRTMRDRLMHVQSLEQMREILAEGPDPHDPTPIVINTDEHEARLRKQSNLILSRDT